MAHVNKFRFSCEYMDDELGVVYYNYRYLDPLSGRWISRDPIQEKDGFNLYVLLGNCPISTTDAFGLLDFNNFSSVVIALIPKQVTHSAKSTRLGVWPLPFFPLVTMEVNAGIDVVVSSCCSCDGQKGLVASGIAYLEGTAGVGTSIGGNSGISARREKKPRRNGTRTVYKKKGDNTYTKKPVGENTGDGTGSSNVGAGGCPERCPDGNGDISFLFTVGASGFISGGIGRFSAGIAFDSPVLKCSVPGGCEALDPRKSSSAYAVYGMGTGMRVQAYGRAEVELSLRIM